MNLSSILWWTLSKQYWLLLGAACPYFVISLPGLSFHLRANLIYLPHLVNTKLMTALDKLHSIPVGYSGSLVGSSIIEWQD